MGISGTQLATHKNICRYDRLGVVDRLSPCLRQILALLLPTSNETSAADSGFNKTENDLMCPGFPNREAEVHRLSLALAVTAITLCCGTVTRAQVSTAFYPVGPTVCQPLPSWYPRGWELMVRYPCATYVYGPSYYPATYYSYPAVYSYQRVSTRAVHRVHRRPYLRPGWWW